MSFPDLLRPKQPSFDRVLKEYENPQSVVNLVSPEVAKAIINLPNRSCELTEEELETKFPDPTATVMQLRKLFWLEFDRAIENRMKMDMSRIYVGVCSRPAFYNVIQKEHQLAWLICPPKEYTIETEELLSVGLKQVREILKLPLKNNLGFVDTKLAEVKLKAVMMLDMRLKGAYIQRSVQANYNVNENRTSQLEAIGSADVVQSLDDKIAQLEAEISATEKKVTTLKPTQQIEDLQTKTVPRVEEVLEAEFKEVPSDAES